MGRSGRSIVVHAHGLPAWTLPAHNRRSAHGTALFLQQACVCVFRSGRLAGWREMQRHTCLF